MIARRYLSEGDFEDIRLGKIRTELDRLNSQRITCASLTSWKYRELGNFKLGILGVGLAAIAGIVLEDMNIAESLKYVFGGAFFVGYGLRSCHELYGEIQIREEEIRKYDEKVEDLLRELGRF